MAFWLKKQQPDLIITRFWIPFMGIALGTILRLFGFNNNTDLIALCDNKSLMKKDLVTVF